MTSKHAKEISNPKRELKRLTKDSSKGEYSEIKHAIELLKRLDTSKLENDFEDFKNLVNQLTHQITF